MKYSKLEIISIFSNCKTWNDLAKVCESFGWLVDNVTDYHNDNDLRDFLRFMANLQFKKIEKL